MVSSKTKARGSPSGYVFSGGTMFHALVENAPDSLVLLDARSRIIYASPSIERWIGYRPEELIGMTAFSLVHPRDREAARRHLEDVVHGRRDVHHRLQYRVRHKNGSYRIMEALIRTRKDGTRGVVCVVTARDITERKQIETELQRAKAHLSQRVCERTAELKYLNEKLRSLASQLALTQERERRKLAVELHDQVGAQLGVLNLYLESAVRSAGKAAVQVHLSRAREALDQATAYTRSLISTLCPSMFHVFGFARAVEHLAEQCLGRHGIRYLVKNDGRRKVMDEDVRDMLFLALREFFLNVVRHARAGRVVVSLKRKGRRVEVTVLDDGAGFDAGQTIPRAVARGSFGLFAVQERAAFLGGKVVVESRPGQGTRAAVIAPLKQ